MKLLIVDNNTKRMGELRSLLKGHEIYSVDVSLFDAEKAKEYDAVILSGSSTHSLNRNLDLYGKELEFIKNTDIPLIGICIGFELIAYAYGATIEKLEQRIEGFMPVTWVDEAHGLFEKQQVLQVHEGHRWTVENMPDSFDILAVSPSGIEVIKHKTKTLYGLQFHPEVVDSAHQDGRIIFEKILSRIKNNKEGTAIEKAAK